MPYALRNYSVPLLLAAVVHLAAVGALYVGWNPVKREAREIKPRIVHSQLLVLQPEARQQPRAAPVVKPPPPVEAAPPPARPKPAPVAETEPPPVDRREQERQRELQRHQQRLAELARQSFAQALESEAGELAEGDNESVAASYRFGIYQRVVANWSRPLSARLGMEARLLVELIPTGRVVSVTVVESSGNAEFDRSAEAAVNKAREFEVPGEPKVFERYFRQFSLLFRPEDLLR